VTETNHDLILELQKRVEQLQEEVESLASSLLEALQDKSNALAGFKGLMAGIAKYKGEVWEFIFRNVDPMNLAPGDGDFYDSLRNTHDD
jgi:hypothetical protein